MTKTINFYSTRTEFGEFSNFARYAITVNSLVYPTSEHYFQAEKFAGLDYSEKVRSAPSPMRAAELGRVRTQPLRLDWEDVKLDIMRAALKAKFTQHHSLKELLLSTGNATLIEHTENDSYWGDGGDGSGKNMLGKLLMELRKSLANDAG